jgi:hypothetical protein
MRPVLRLLGTRYGMALVILLVVLGIVGITRAVAGSYRSTAAYPGSASSHAAVTANPSAGDDSVASPQTPPAPSTSPGATPPEAVADSFMRAWLVNEGVTSAQWQAGIAKYATSRLRDKLKNVDPSGGPTRMTGPITLQSRAASFVQATVPVDAGSVQLRLVATNGRWLVDGVDWERA